MHDSSIGASSGVLSLSISLCASILQLYSHTYQSQKMPLTHTIHPPHRRRHGTRHVYPFQSRFSYSVSSSIECTLGLTVWSAAQQHMCVWIWSERCSKKINICLINIREYSVSFRSSYATAFLHKKLHGLFAFYRTPCLVSIGSA